eukprot:3922583-Pleurochrysis_carterae.AAC.1
MCMCRRRFGASVPPPCFRHLLSDLAADLCFEPSPLGALLLAVAVVALSPCLPVSPFRRPSLSSARLLRQVLDTFMLTLNDTKLYPRMNEIALIGHSAGGQT